MYISLPWRRQVMQCSPVWEGAHDKSLNSLSPNSDPHPISPNINTDCTAWSNRQVVKIIEIITKDEMLWC